MAHFDRKCAMRFEISIKCCIFVANMISIIIPVYNLESLLQRSVDSVKAQTITDWELIMVNDGSSDSSGKLCDAIAHTDERIHVLHGKNAGAGAARKLGVAKAKGEWVMMLDGDDVLPPDALEQFLTRVSDDVDIIVGSARRCTDEGYYPHLMEQSRTMTGKEYIKALLNYETSVGPVAKLMRRSLFLDGKWIPHRRIIHFEDLLMLVSIAGEARKVVIDNSLHVYDVIFRSDGLSHKMTMTFEGWYRLFNGISRFADEETALLFKLHRLYDGCIAQGVEFDSSNPEIQCIIKDARRYKLRGHDKLIYYMLHSKRLRRYVAKRHKDVQQVSGAIKVSVVMSAYNEAKSIEKAMRSVLQQTFREIELIVVDDGSTDDTLAVIRTIAAVDGRVKVVCHNDNLGLSASRRTGWKLAIGDYVQFMDGSDTLNPMAIEHMYERAKMTGAEIIVMGSQRESRFLGIKIPFFVPSKVFKEEKTITTTELLPTILGRHGFSHRLVDKLFLREALEKVNPLSESNFYGEDFLTTIRMFKHKFEVSYTDYLGYNWKMGGQSTSMSKEEQWANDKFLYETSVELLKELSIDKTENRQAMAKGLADCFINSIAHTIANPFLTKEKRSKWVDEVLHDQVWKNVSPLLVEEAYRPLKDKNVDALIGIATEKFKSSQLFYCLMQVYKFL